jgi:putative hydrolase of the HAD superfamily
MIHTLLFDLDDTLYPPETGLMEQIRLLILQYIEKELQLPEAEADRLRRRYLASYGTTMRGLQIKHQIDADGYLQFVHDIPLHEYLAANPSLDAALARITQEKVIFTNASREHAERVLMILGIRRHFSRIIDVRDVSFESKPQPAAYQRACQILEVRPEQCALVEDSVRNLVAAKELGMTTILVWDRKGDLSTAERLDYGPVVDYELDRIEAIDRLAAQLGRVGRH